MIDDMVHRSVMFQGEGSILTSCFVSPMTIDLILGLILFTLVVDGMRPLILLGEFANRRIGVERSFDGESTSGVSSTAAD